MTIVLIGKGLVLGGWPSKIGVTGALGNSYNAPIRNLWLEDSRIPSDLPRNKDESLSTRLGFDSNGLRFGDSQDEFEKIQEAYEKLGSALTWNHENFFANKVL